MLSLADISQAIDAYKDGNASLDQFADWFHAASRGRFGESEEVLQACLEIDAAFSMLSYEGLTESAFQKELAEAVRPFASSEPSTIVVYKFSKQQVAAHRPVASAAAAMVIVLLVVGDNSLGSTASATQSQSWKMAAVA